MRESLILRARVDANKIGSTTLVQCPTVNNQSFVVNPSQTAETGVTQPLSLETITVGSDCAVIRLAGEIDVYTASQLRETVVDLIANGVSHVIADLRAVEFLDSTGLGAIVGGHKRLRTIDGSLVLAASPDRILRLFRITGLDQAFSLCPSVPGAIAAEEVWQAAIAGEATDPDDWCRKHNVL
jgi:anti-sigma B factor antagonist